MTPQTLQRIAGEPAWEIAHLFPPQGYWTEWEYLSLNTNRLVELCDGNLEVLPMPTELHQLVMLFLYESLQQFVRPRSLGMVLVAPLRVRVREGNIREPDIVFMLAENSHRRTNKVWDGADLVMEVVSEDDPNRDLVEKRRDYAAAGIPEYWIIDPRDHSVTVLTLDTSSNSYHEKVRATDGDEAASTLLPGFSVDVSEVFSRQH